MVMNFHHTTATINRNLNKGAFVFDAHVVIRMSAVSTAIIIILALIQSTLIALNVRAG